MIFEIRTYDLKPRSIPEFEKRFGEKLPNRLPYSKLWGFFHTEIGPLNQVLHIWPYEDLNQRTQTRARAAADGKWPPDNTEFIVNMQSDIFIPAPFMNTKGERKIGPIYEMRIYTYAPGAIPKVLEAWAGRIAEREKLSPLAGCWYSDIGGLNKFVHLWAYKSLDERSRVRAEAQKTGIWPPPSGVVPLKQENKILMPASFSSMQ
jgi:hypothetical protein